MAPGTLASALRNQGTGTLTVTGDIGAGKEEQCEITSDMM
jgi:hypothetical protein